MNLFYQLYTQIHLALPSAAHGWETQEMVAEWKTERSVLQAENPWFLGLGGEKDQRGFPGQIYYSPFHCILSPTLPGPL